MRRLSSWTFRLPSSTSRMALLRARIGSKSWRLKRMDASTHSPRHSSRESPATRYIQFGGALGHGLGLLEHQTEAGARLLPDEVIISAVAVGEGLSGQKLARRRAASVLAGRSDEAYT